ncbi:MAG: ThuA domain-containing protein [Verrucomicrobiales bacterium]
MTTRLGLFSILAGLTSAPSLTADTLAFPLRTRAATNLGIDIKATPVSWKVAETALIVCDFWDSHNCGNAAKRVNEMAPRLAEVVEQARQRGVFIIHAPSDCMKNYEDHPARKRAQEASKAANLPAGIDKWLYWKDAIEEKAGYPIDATDGGCDDTPEEAAAWKKQLAAEGRDQQKWPWRGEHPSIKIDAERDAISDKGVEVWNMLEQRGIKHVLFTGVHTNMCVCGRPFGLRQLSNHGKNIVLVRDLTDTMYNPSKPPFVSHYRGTELMLAHVEKLICPTTSSSELFGGQSYTFPGDKRPSLAVMIGEDEYKTWETLPAFMEDKLGKDFRINYVLETTAKSGEFAGMDALKTADALVVSVRRRALPKDQLDAVRAFVARGGAVVGLRTTSHAFALRSNAEPPPGRAVWPDWDEKVLGGNYQSHSGKDAKTFATTAAPSSKEPSEAHWFLEGVPRHEFPTGGSLYKNTPLRGKVEVLMVGYVEGSDTTQPGACEPVAWTHTSPGGGRVFYTSLGHADDFKRPEFCRLLENAIRWAATAEKR